MEEQKKSKSVFVGTAVALIIAVTGYGFYRYTKKDQVTIEPVVTTPTTPSETPITYVYKNGEYSSTGNYMTPDGVETIGIKVTLKNDVIVDTVATKEAIRSESKRYQDRFISGYKTLVVGKKLDEVKLDKVSGSSLTPKGFNDAIVKIKTQAKA